MTPPPFAPFKPTPLTTGGATASNSSGFPNDAVTGRLVADLASHPSRPSAASMLTSWGIALGTAPAGVRMIVADATLHQVFGTFHTIGNWAGASVRATIRLLVQEFDPSGTFTREMPGGEAIIQDQSPWYLAGSDRFPSRLAPDSVLSEWFPARAGFFYTLWVDLQASLRADGMSGAPFFFGSQADISCWIEIPSLGGFFAT